MSRRKQSLKRTASWRRPLAAVALAVIALAGCGGGGSKTSGSTTHGRKSSADTHTTKTVRHVPPPGPPYPKVIGGALTSGSAAFVPAAKWHGQTAAWIAHLPSGIQMLSFNQHIVSLRLHSGTVDAGTSGWRYGPDIAGPELSRVVAAFNGGFRLDTGSGGFESYGRVAVPLRAGLGSIVTYKNGTTDVGSWRGEVPAAGQPIASVRQNLTLLIDHGHSAASVGCDSCWGATLGGVADPARAALGIAANGNLIWAAGEHATVATLADALLHAHVVRAAALDINPEWVAGYLYAHHSVHGRPVPLPVVVGQNGIPGEFLIPWSRDFFTVVVR
jgi:hypothetical protein